MFNTLLALVGAWLLFIGPVYQASLEMRSHEFALNHAPIRNRFTAPAVSKWWWLLPPVKYVLEYRRSEWIRDMYVASLSQEQLKVLVDYFNRATGWMLVGAGAFCLAMRETIELFEHFAFAWWTAVIASLALASLSVVFVQKRLHTSSHMVSTREVTL